MDRDFEDIYYGLYTLAYVTDDPTFFEFRTRSRSLSREGNQTLRVRRAIEAADTLNVREGGPSLRPDAKYLLLINLMEMVVKPLIVRDARSPYLQSDDLEHDVETVVKLASDREVNRQRLPTTISAHSLLDALVDSWGQLRISQVSLWGA